MLSITCRAAPGGAGSLPLDSAIKHFVSDPLGLAATGFSPDSALRSEIAPTEWDDQWRGGLVHGSVHDESAHALGGVAGHAGLFSSADDIGRTMALSWARLPAPMTIEPAGRWYSPTRRSWINE